MQSDSPAMEADKLATVADLIDAFGGPARFARALDLKGPSTASEMKRAGSIAVKHWPKVLAAAGDAGIRGLDYRHLVDMHAKSGEQAGATQ